MGHVPSTPVCKSAITAESLKVSICDPPGTKVSGDFSHGTGGEFTEPPQRTIRNQLRNELRRLRRQRKNWQLFADSKRLQLQLLLRRFRAGARIAAYVARDGELSPLLQLPLADKFRIYLPRMQTGRKQPVFVRWVPGNRLQCGKFGIFEPRGRSLSVRRLDLVLIPMIAFDRSGNRLGHGTGAYDRAFGWCHNTRFRQHPLLVGIAHSQQELAAIPAQPLDIAMDAVLTERGLYRC